MNKYQKYKEENGFTLLELIVTLTILTIVVVLAFGAFRLGIKAWEKGNERTEFLYRMKYLVDLMEKEMGSIYPYYAREESEQLKVKDLQDEKKQVAESVAEDKNEEFTNLSSEDESKPPEENKQTKVTGLIFEGKRDSIRFISSSDNRDPSISGGGLREVSFSLNRSKKQLIMTEGIIQSKQPFRRKNHKKKRSVVLSSDVSSLKFRYYKLKNNYRAKYEYDGKWVNNFKAGNGKLKSINLPRAIEVTMVIETEKEGINKKTETFYLPPFIILLNAGLDLVPTRKIEEKT